MRFANQGRSAFLALILSMGASAAGAQKATECTKLEFCYCVDAAQNPVIDKNVAYFRDQIAAQRKAGRAVGYLSVPLSSIGGGVFHINSEVASSVKAAVEKRFGADQVWLLNPSVPESNIPGGTGADYMLMWTRILEGAAGTGDIDFTYFVGPQDFARFFALDGVGDMARLEQYFDTRAKSDAGLQKAIEKGLTRMAFRNYYAFKASTTISRGAHDEWNIVRAINERRRASDKFGLGDQIATLFDGHAVSVSEFEAATSQGYAGRCTN